IQRLDDLPLYFVENKGQAAAEVKFQVKTPQADVLFSANEIVYQFVGNEQKNTETGAPLPSRREELRVGFVGAGQKTKISGEKITSAKFNYLRGSDPSKWVGEAAAYEKILYRELYPGINLLVAGNGKRIKNEYLVKAGTDPAAIQLKYGGADGLSVNGSGQLEVRIGTEKMIEDAPSCYQILDGKKVNVEAVYRLGLDQAVSFAVGPYRKDADLIIDPVIYSTFLSGSGSCYSKAIAVDSGGNAFITGSTYSDFSTTAGAFDTSHNGGYYDAFVMKLNASGSGVLYATFLGGNAEDSGLGIAVDGSGNAYVIGATKSADFPVTAGAFDMTYNGGDSAGGDCFVTKLNPAGSALVYSTYLGGSGAEPDYREYYYYSSLYDDCGNRIAVDNSGSAYVAGWTRSADFPTTAGAFDPSFNETGTLTGGDGFVAKFNASGTGLVYSTFLGGSSVDIPRGIALDNGGYLYVTGETRSADFPVTAGAYDIGLDGRDAFVTKLNPAGSGIVYSTYLGGGNSDWGNAIVVDSGGNAYVVGTAVSNNFPMTSGAWDTTYNGATDAFVAKLNDTGSSLLYATYLGGADEDYGIGIAIDGSGNAYMSGTTSSSDFPIVPGYIATVRGGREVFVSKLNASGSNLLYSTFIGGSYEDTAKGMTIDGSGNIYLTGFGSTGFPVTDGAYDTQGSESFVLKMTAAPVLVSLQVNKSSLQFSAIASGGVATRNQTVLITGTGPGTLNWTAVADQTWIKITPASGAGNGVIQVGVDATGLTGGEWGSYHSGKIKISDPNAAGSPKWIDVVLRVYTLGVTNPPFGYFDTPLNGTSGITGAVPVTGWALDDVEVANVKIYRDPVAGEPSGLVFIGDAVFVEGARPDIEGDWRLGGNYPLRSFAGWGYMMLTNMLPNHGNGPYKLYAYAYDKEGNNALLGTKSIFCDNAHAVKPFGTIDTPVQGGAVSGSAYINYAWALTPLPNMIPKDGSTIDVWVDGQNLGHPTYNQYRKDVADAFPGLNNSGGPVGYYYLDATKFTNGVHAIQWVVTDNGGNNDGIGSRFFTVLNVGTPAPGVVGASEIRLKESSRALRGISYTHATPLYSAADILNLPMTFEPVGVKTGFDLKAAPTALAPDHYGLFHIQTRELELIRISLDPAQAHQAGNETAGKGLGERYNPPTPPFRKGGEDGRQSGMREGVEADKYSGYFVAGGELRPLPIGSTLDARTGAFSWMPGPGFSGAYDFVFVEKDASGPTRSIKVKVTIRPKF
ncbi:MAG: SBBP repeat-containing protein, partial [Candidatus Aminicenantes bacterium]|nr:SBBP repeat-containing protein [Candidatus Aminicenantes bacterium]